MKIVCDACQAKYSISDDKVQGKVFKIRCKKCSNIIVVRGSAAAEPAPSPQQEKETHVYDYGYQGGGPAADDAVWHVVINQDQVGPMTVAEVHARFNAGEIDVETYVWREGFADWSPLNQVDAFASFAAAASAAVPASAGGGGQAAVAAMFGSGGGDDVGTTRSDPGDLFAAASSSHRHEDDTGGDLFGSAPVAQQQPQGAQKLRGERNENSVLFSLNNLAALASDKPAPSPSSQSSSSSAGHATGAAGGEGSGLIDIRSMASAYLGNAGASARPAASVGSAEDLPVFGGGGFHEPAVLVPTARPQNNNKLLFVMFGAVGLLAVAALVMVVILIKGGKGGNDKDDTKLAQADMKGAVDDKTGTDKTDKTDTKATTAAAGSGSTGTTTGAAKPPDDKQDPKTTDTPTTGTTDPKAADPKATPPTDAKKDPPKQPKTQPKTTQVAKTDKGTKLDPNVVKQFGDPKKTDKKVDKGTAPSTGGDCDEVSCTIGTASGPCCDKFKKGGGGTRPSGGDAPKSGGNSNLPDGLDRDSISAGMAPVKSRAMSCGDKAPGVHGVVKVHVKVGPGGNVTSVSVSQSPDDKLGGCVQAQVQRASFAKTQHGGSFSIPYTF